MNMNWRMPPNSFLGCVKYLLHFTKGGLRVLQLFFKAALVYAISNYLGFSTLTIILMLAALLLGSLNFSSGKTKTIKTKSSKIYVWKTKNGKFQKIEKDHL
jgi:hypothetical protein